jgi:hypothetical protein
MALVTVLITGDLDAPLRLQPMDAAELEAAVDADIAKFDEYFQRELKNEPLIKSEYAMLKTYLWWKTRQEKPDASEESPSV